MASVQKVKSLAAKRGPGCPVMGMEAEFTSIIGGNHQLPEKYFGTPAHLIGVPAMRRTGRSVHLPSGGALYFDTGVIEVATPIIEIEAGCAIRTTRSLWEQIGYLRKTLDRWESDRNTQIQLQGFSTHYNVSFDTDPTAPWRTPEKLALLLANIIPIPVMLLAANRRSTGIGVRPRGHRIEVTTDFTPDPDLMACAASLITAVVRAVMAWPDYELTQLDRRNIPRIAGFSLRKHTSRKGWLARHDRFPRNPFISDLLAEDWLLQDGRQTSLRKMAREIANPFRSAIQAITPAKTYEHIFAVIDGRARSLLDFPDRPESYEDAGRAIQWNRRAHRRLPRSRYEQVIFKVLAGRTIRTEKGSLKPERMRGWHQVVMRNESNGKVHVMDLDELAEATWNGHKEKVVYPD